MKDMTIIIIGMIITCCIVGALYIGTKTDAIILYMNKDNLTPPPNHLVIIPTLTANAYKDGGFYDYYSGKCDKSCLSVKIDQGIALGEAGSQNAVLTLKRLGYAMNNDYVIDYMLRSDPHYLDGYHTVIVLHSEYVTQRLYDALTSHGMVIYLTPNANYAKIEINKGMMTLLEGHSYKKDGNVFGWPYDNTVQEYDKQCKSWEFEPISNGYQLNCNPELVINTMIPLLKKLQNLQQ